MRVLRGEERVMLAKYTERQEAGKKNDAEWRRRNGSSSPSLVARLKAVRREEAARIKMPPYLIFSDASLEDMARLRPRSLDEFRNVSGAGEIKTARFGPIFIAAIAEFESGRML